MQEVHVQPHRCYRVSVWVKTENLQPAEAFAISVLNQDRSIASLKPSLPPTSDWKKIQFLFNSATFDTVRLYAGVWGGKSGKFWLDDWTLEEMGPLNVLRRPGTPVTVKSADGATTYAEGRDYEPLIDPAYTPYNIARTAPPLKLAPGSRIQDGARLQVSGIIRWRSARGKSASAWPSRNCMRSLMPRPNCWRSGCTPNMCC